MRGNLVRLHASAVALLLVAACALSAPVPTPEAAQPQEAIQRVVNDYVGLYARATLEQWKTLFHPALTAAHPADDGSVRVRTLEEFFSAQKNYFETGRKISERLDNVRIDAGRRIARVTADFIFVDEGEERRGKLGLHLVESQDGWKIVAIVFSYDEL